jgi:hypothetical protein
MSDLQPIQSTPSPEVAVPTTPEKARIEAALKAGEEMMKQASAPKQEAKPDTSQPVNVAPTPAVEQPKTPAPVDNVDVPRQFKKPDGTIDEAKLAQSTHSLEEEVARKREALEKYKEKRRELTTVSEELSALKKDPQLQKPEIPAGQRPASLEELKKSLAAKLQDDPVEAVLYGAEIMSDYKMSQIKAELDAIKSEKKETSFASLLDEAAAKRPWMYEAQGIEAINQVLKAKPYLWQAANPYEEAATFAEKMLPTNSNVSNTPATNVHQPTTPILGNGHAVPPPVVTPVSNEQRLEELGAQLAAAHRDPAKARAIEDQMRAIVKQMTDAML